MTDPDLTATDVDLTDSRASPGLASPGLTDGASNRSQVERDLDDAVYYLQRDCIPCAQRYFDRARRHGASEEAIELARLSARVM